MRMHGSVIIFANHTLFVNLKDHPFLDWFIGRAAFQENWKISFTQ